MTSNSQIAAELDNIRQALTNISHLLRDTASVGLTDTQTYEVPGQGTWTRADLEWLAGVIDTRPIAAAVIDMASEAASHGSTVTWPQVLEATGAPDNNESRSHLGQLTEWAKQRFGDRRWPVEARQSSTADGKMTYRMPPALAAAWRDLRGI